MGKWSVLIVLVSLVTGRQCHMVELVEMLVSEPRDAVHHVDQDSSGIQKIKILVESDRMMSAISRNPMTVLPLSIETAANGLNDDGMGHSRSGMRETLNKRQATVSKNKPTQRPTAVVDRKPVLVDSRKSDTPETASQHKDTKTKFEQPKVRKVKPEPNQFGLGSTLVLTVKTPDSGEPTYVDQTQPHKLARPLKYEPNVGPARPVSNATPQSPVYQAEDKSTRRPIYVESLGNEAIGGYSDKRTQLGSNHQQQQQQQQQTQRQSQIQRQSEPTDYVETISETDNVGVQEQADGSSKTIYEQKEWSTSGRKPVNINVNAQNSQPRPAVNQRPLPDYNEYESIEQTQPVRRPPSYVTAEYEQSSQSGRRPPTQEDSRPSYVDIRPSYEKQPAYQDNNRRRPPQQPEETDNSYAGFPESYNPTKYPTQSRPLQYEPTRVFPPSPCHSVFQYDGREPEDDYWMGDIYVSTDEVLVGLRLDITLDRPARLLSNWISGAKTKDNMHYTILSLKKRLIPGPAEAVRILIRFDPDGPVPFLSSINLNGRKICPGRSQAQSRPTPQPVFENPGDLVTKPTTPAYIEPDRRPHIEYEPTTHRVPTRNTERYTDRRTTTLRPRPTQNYQPLRPDPNPNYIPESDANRVPSQASAEYVPRPSATATSDRTTCGKPSVQPRPLVTYGQMTARGQWPWHAAIYKNVNIDLSYICGGSLISSRHVVTAAHCVTQTYDTKPLDATILVVYLGKYHLKLWSEGGVQNKQVTDVIVHPKYNNTDFHADLAVLVLSSPVDFTEFIRPVCLWDPRKSDIAEVEGKEGTVIGWGFDESKRLTEELMQAKMPVIKDNVCLRSYPDFFPQFTSNYTYCAGFRNGTSVCNGDSGGGMVFPLKSNNEERWFLRGLVSISVSEKEQRVCDTKHYVVFTDLAKFSSWLGQFL